MPLQAAVPLQYVFLRRTRDAGEGSPSNHGIAVDTGQSVGRPGRGARPPGRGARPPGRGARPARARSGAGSPAGFVPPRRDLIPHFAPRVWLFLEGAARPGPGSRCRGSRDGQGAARRCPGQSRRGPRFPCDGAAPAGPVVRRRGLRLWWIRALRWTPGTVTRAMTTAAARSAATHSNKAAPLPHCLPHFAPPRLPGGSVGKPRR
jgi:hypothetical protein